MGNPLRSFFVGGDEILPAAWRKCHSWGTVKPNEEFVIPMRGEEKPKLDLYRRAFIDVWGGCDCIFNAQDLGRWYHLYSIKMEHLRILGYERKQEDDWIWTELRVVAKNIEYCEHYAENSWIQIPVGLYPTTAKPVYDIMVLPTRPAFAPDFVRQFYKNAK